MKTYNKKNKKKILRFLALGLLLCGLLEIFSPLMQSNISNKQEVNQYQEPQFKGAYYSNSMTAIAIDGDATGFGAHNWSWAVNQPWCSGSGTELDPYVIMNLKIDGMSSSSCILIEDSNVFLVIENCTLFNTTIPYGGIYLKNSKNVELRNNIIFDNQYGIFLDSSINNVIIGNNCSYYGEVGIALLYSSNNTVLENVCNSNVYGIYLYFSDSNNIIENNCSLNNYGIYVIGSNNNTILDNDCSSNTDEGIMLYSSSNYTTISGNDCSSNAGAGLVLYPSSYNTIIDNDCSSNGEAGILLYFSNDNLVSENNCSSNGVHGVYIHSSSNHTIVDNDCSLCGENGIRLYNTEYSEIYENKILSSINNGIQLIENSHHNEIYSNEIKNSSNFGILIETSNSHNNTIYRNEILNNGEQACDNGTDNYWDNGFIGNFWDDYAGSDADLDGIGDDPYVINGIGGAIDHFPIWFFYNLNPIFIDDDATGVGAHNWTWAANQPWCEGSGTWNDPYIISDVIIDGQGTDNCIEIQNSNVPFIIRNSTLYNASPLDYKAAIHLDHVNNSLILENNCSNNGHIGIILYENCNNNIIKGNIMHENQNAAISIRVSSENNIIIDNWIANSSGNFAIYLLNSNYNTFSNNTIQGCLTGIRIHATEHTTVMGNIFESNQIGISLKHGHYSIITNNIIRDSWNFGIRSEQTAFCEIHDNLIYNTTYDGIRLLDNCRYNEIYSNEIQKSSRYGVNLDDTNVHNNTIYRNYLVDNDQNAYDDGTDNYWDNGFIGNYWDDYTGSDSDLDGIGDTPYSISGTGGGIDHLPIWFFYVLNPIFIDGDATGVGAHNWTWAAYQPWCSGSGTEIDPYVIANVTIDGMGTSSCIKIRDSDVFFVIENCTLFNSGIQLDRGGVYLDHCNNGEINKNAFSSTFAGVHLIQSHNNTVSGNNCSANGRYGIRLYSSSNNTFIENDCSANDWVGIHLKLSNDDNRFLRNNCSSNGLYGIELDSSSNNIFSENDCSSNIRHGIHVYSSSNYNLISRNNCSSNQQYGIRLESTKNNIVLGNNCSFNLLDGIYLVQISSNNEITENNCYSNDNSGINLVNSNNSLISNNDCRFNDNDGIELESSSTNNTISRNTCFSNEDHGIYIYLSNNNTIANNLCSLNGHHGIDLFHSLNNTIVGNTYYLNYRGIYLFYAPHNIISLNNCTSNSIEGIRLLNSNENFISLNNCSLNEYGISGYNSNFTTISECECSSNGDVAINLGLSNNNTVSKNTCFSNSQGIVIFRSNNSEIIHNDCSLNYWYGIRISYSSNNIISANNCSSNSHHGIFIHSSNTNTISNNFCSLNLDYGISLASSEMIIISENKCFSNDKGIFLDSSINNTISGNLCNLNHEGIEFVSSSNNTISENDCIMNIYRGISLRYSDKNKILKNNCSSNLYYGIYLYESGPLNVISENIVFNSSSRGIYLLHTNGTIIFLNEIIDNAVQAYDDGINNQWDDGSIGNYWSDYWDVYSGVDLDDDGIGDIPYNITGSAESQDRYPIWDDGPGENHPPTWDQMLSNQTLEFGIPFFYDVNTSDTSGIDTYWINNTSNFMIDANGMIHNITTLFAGEYWLEISVNDTYDNLLSTTIRINVEPSLPPNWDPLPSNQIDEFGTNFAYSVNAVDISGIDSYWINDSTYFQINNDGLITHLIEIPVGIYWLKISVNDTLGNVNSTVIKVTIQDTTPPDWVYLPEDQDLEYGTSLSYDVSAWDPSGIDTYWINDTSTFHINVNGLITNCSYLTVKTYWLEISVNDTIGLITNSIIKITVVDTTNPIWIELPTDQLIDMENTFKYNVNASDLSGIDYYWISDTSNFQIDNNGLITSIGTLSVGTYSIEIRAYDPWGNYCTATIEVFVSSESGTAPPGIPGYDILLLLLTVGISGVYLLLHITKKRRII